jgi:hypothetical protein
MTARFLPMLVLSLVAMMPAKSTAGGSRHPMHPTPVECCDSLINVNISPTIVFAPTVNIASFWTNNDFLSYDNLLSNNDIASDNANNLTVLLGELNVLSENQVVIGLINGVVYYAEGH